MSPTVITHTSKSLYPCMYVRVCVCSDMLSMCSPCSTVCMCAYCNSVKIVNVDSLLTQSVVHQIRQPGRDFNREQTKVGDTLDSSSTCTVHFFTKLVSIIVQSLYSVYKLYTEPCACPVLGAI